MPPKGTGKHRYDVAPSTALELAQSKVGLAPLDPSDILGLVKRFAFTGFGGPGGGVCNQSIIGFIDSLNAQFNLRPENGTEPEPGITTLTVESRPPLEDVIYMAKTTDGRTSLVAVPNQAVADKMKEHGFAACSSFTWVSTADAWNAFSGANPVSAFGSESVTGGGGGGAAESGGVAGKSEATVVTVPFEQPALLTKAGSPSAAAQIVAWMEVSCVDVIGAILKCAKLQICR